MTYPLLFAIDVALTPWDRDRIGGAVTVTLVLIIVGYPK
jgi:uncharacterized MnhB-related membrane protein